MPSYLKYYKYSSLEFSRKSYFNKLEEVFCNSVRYSCISNLFHGIANTDSAKDVLGRIDSVFQCFNTELHLPSEHPHTEKTRRIYSSIIHCFIVLKFVFWNDFPKKSPHI